MFSEFQTLWNFGFIQVLSSFQCMTVCQSLFNCCIAMKLVFLLTVALFYGSFVDGALEYAPVSQELSPSILDEYNAQLREYNHLQAELAWNMSVDLEHAPVALEQNERILVGKNLWNNEWCMRLLAHTSVSPSGLSLASITERRQVYLVCRGPRFSSYQVSKLLGILAELRTGYDTTRICLKETCYRMEPDLNHFMETSRSEPELREAWTKWHSTIGQALAKPYVDLVRLLNVGARQAGHPDIGACWREEMETEGLVDQSLSLYADVKRLYALLHAYVRHRLEKWYKIPLGPRGLIPAHLLGNMWSQRWDSLMDIVAGEGDKAPETSADYIRAHIGPKATVMDMVRYAEKYYIRMGFPPLPASFYTNSYFTTDSTGNSSHNCHGSAANMFADPAGTLHGEDFRIMMCARVQDSDLATIIHEMGHVHYFGAYKQLPTIFQDGANAAFHEAVGDSTVYGMYPNPSIRDLLRLGLMKLPQIGFGLVVDLWRWKVFADEAGAASKADVDVGAWNRLWWELQGEFMGVSRPETDGKDGIGLDALGKYHIVDNIPYIRYFHASFLQHMFYASMCRGGGVGGSAGGRNGTYCGLQGRGHKLRQMMAQGSSKHWSAVLKEMTGSSRVTAQPLLDYFKPLQDWLEERVAELGLRVGW